MSGRAIPKCRRCGALGALREHVCVRRRRAVARQPDAVPVDAAGLRVVLIYAARYAMGRASGALDDVRRVLATHAATLHAEDVRGLRDDAARMLRFPPGDATARADLEALVAWCDGELARRGAS